MKLGAEARSVLATLTSGEDRGSLVRILASAEWDLRFAPSLQEAEAVACASPIGVVISNARLADGHSWKDLLEVVQSLPSAPQLIVADRLADEVLWAEVLNLGGYDLLMTPFQPQEVLRVVLMAWEFRKRELEQAAAPGIPAKSAEIQRPAVVKTMIAGAAWRLG